MRMPTKLQNLAFFRDKDAGWRMFRQNNTVGFTLRVESPPRVLFFAGERRWRGDGGRCRIRDIKMHTGLDVLARVNAVFLFHNIEKIGETADGLRRSQKQIAAGT